MPILRSKFMAILRWLVCRKWEFSVQTCKFNTSNVIQIWRKIRLQKILIFELPRKSPDISWFFLFGTKIFSIGISHWCLKVSISWKFFFLILLPKHNLKSTIILTKDWHNYLKGRNFRGKKISQILRILAKFAKFDSFFDPKLCQFAKINSHEIFQKFMNREYWSFCPIQCLLN